MINQCFHLVRDIGQCCTVSPDLDPPDILSPPGPGLDCHKVSAWSQFLHHSSGNTQTSQPRIPTNHPQDLQVKTVSLEMFVIVIICLGIFLKHGWIEIMIQLTLVLIALPDLHRFPVAIFAIIGWWRRVALPEPHFCSYTTGPGTIGPAFP